MSELQGTRRFTDILDDILNIGYSAWRFRWTGVAVMFVMCLIGWSVVLGLPNIYSASSRLFIDTQTSLRPLLQGLAVNTDMTSEALIMARSLTSRPNLERIAAVSGLTLSDSPPSEVRAAITKLQGELDIAFDSSQVLSIGYQNKNPKIALSVVSQLIDLFVEGLLGENRSDSDSARDFLILKIREYEELLNEAERRLAQFKKENIGQMPGERGDYFARLQMEQETLNKLDLDLGVARKRQEELYRQLEGETPVFGMVSPAPTGSAGSGISSVIGRQISEYEQELARLRIQYTDSHPDIMRIMGILEDLRAKQAEEQQNLSGVSGSQGSGSLNENPVFQSMRLQLSSVELKIVQLQAKRDSQARRVSELRNKVDIIPDIEAQLTKLNRDYEVNKAQYDALLQRLESARLTEAAERSKNKFDFRIIDPPSVTPDPVGPNRTLFITAVLVLAIGAGVAYAVLMSFMRPVFFSMRSLEQHFGVPVLGGIKYMPSAKDKVARKRDIFLIVVAFLVLVSGYDLITVFNQVGAEFVGDLLLIAGQ